MSRIPSRFFKIISFRNIQRYHQKFFKDWFRLDNHPGIFLGNALRDSFVNSASFFWLSSEWTKNWRIVWGTSVNLHCGRNSRRNIWRDSWRICGQTLNEAFGGFFRKKKTRKSPLMKFLEGSLKEICERCFEGIPEGILD